MVKQLLQGKAVTEALMLTTSDLAKLLQCSSRNVSRLEQSGRIPRANRVGALVRWPRTAIENWIESGCPTLAV